MTRVVLAVDKFKGSLTAAEVAHHARRGLLAARPDLDVVQIPVADGGDGTLDAVLAAGFSEVPVRCTGPTGEAVQSRYARRDEVAVVEMADACGILRLPHEPDPETGAVSSSRGLGEVIARALDGGAREVTVGIGGSASTDGGAGMLQALGAALLDGEGDDVGPGWRGVSAIESVDLTGLHPRLAEVRLRVACDVNNPLLGERGAAAIFGPQKGVAEVQQADDAVRRLADLLEPALGFDGDATTPRDQPGAGAAGGVGWALALLGAELTPGIELTLDLGRFDELAADADLVVTGEGSLDEQSLLGKTPVGVAQAAGQLGVPCVAVCGRSMVSAGRAAEAGLQQVFALSDLEPDPAECMRRAGELLEDLMPRVEEGLSR